MPIPDHDIIDQLRKEILRMEGFKQKPVNTAAGLSKLHPLLQSFPNQSFPTGVIHELLCTTQEQTAASAGFILTVINELSSSQGVMVWIGSSNTIYPVALAGYGFDPADILFINVKTEKDALWVMEEVLKCDAVSFVMAELNTLSFSASRRLQLAVENSGVTGFVLRFNTNRLNTTACVVRWNIIAAASEQIGDLPGIGYPCWHVELLRIRNGKPGSWKIACKNGQLNIVDTNNSQQSVRIRKVV